MLKLVEKLKPLTRFRIALVLALLGMLPVAWTSAAALVPGGSGSPTTVFVFIAMMMIEWAAITVLVQASAALSAANRKLESIVGEELGTATDEIGPGVWLESDKVEWLNPDDILFNTHTEQAFRQTVRSRNSMPCWYRIQRSAESQMPEILYGESDRPSPVKRAGGRHRLDIIEHVDSSPRLFTHADLFSNRDA